ncbi:hypothetical protein [Streptomyces sp. NBC_00690]|nr:hypothetical protein [Streptomyces sp. NBC_00690]
MTKSSRETDMARHLQRVCGRFSTRIGPESARRLARLLERQPGGKVD